MPLTFSASFDALSCESGNERLGLYNPHQNTLSSNILLCVALVPFFLYRTGTTDFNLIFLFPKTFVSRQL
jgi:hypothetical protein